MSFSKCLLFFIPKPLVFVGLFKWWSGIPSIYLISKPLGANSFRQKWTLHYIWWGQGGLTFCRFYNFFTNFLQYTWGYKISKSTGFLWHFNKDFLQSTVFLAKKPVYKTTGFVLKNCRFYNQNLTNLQSTFDCPPPILGGSETLIFWPRNGLIWE